ncbi:NAD-dependent epimerase/dehydratase family protein [Maribacter sp. X9]|uniref:NAD-dependent epimerase/dehydratase family protein n=1 Tax=Maribacter sp. X9 TaxID=3402159 RepID=UPI003AF3919C
MSNRIGIIGCGWLGLPLAEELQKTGFTVSGTTTSKVKLSSLREKGINPYQISISENKIEGPIAEFLESISLLIINIPPGLRGKGPKESYVAKIKLLYEAIKKTDLEKVIFISSTSVYGDVEGIVTENTRPIPTTESGKQLLECENMFKKDPEINSNIIRFGGLIGKDRHPITMLSGKQNLKDGNAPINLIHKNDCIGIIKLLITKDHWGEILNAVYPDHPTKESYYSKEALKRNLPPPTYESNNHNASKLIDTCSDFLINNYNFFTPIN